MNHLNGLDGLGINSCSSLTFGHGCNEGSKLNVLGLSPYKSPVAISFLCHVMAMYVLWQGTAKIDGAALKAATNARVLACADAPGPRTMSACPQTTRKCTSTYGRATPSMGWNQKSGEST